MKISDRLKRAREALGLKQPAAAKLAGASTRQTITNWEGGKGEPTVAYLEALVSRGIDAEWLITGRGQMMATPPDAKAEAFDRIAEIVAEVGRGGGEAPPILDIGDPL